MTAKCLHNADILAQASRTLAVSLAIGISIGIVLVLLYCVTTRRLLPKYKQSTTSNYVAPTGAIQKQALQPPRPKIKYQTSNSTTISGVSDDQGEKNHRHQHEKLMLPKQGKEQLRGRSRGPAAIPDSCVNHKKNLPGNYNPYPNQQDEESEMYVNFSDPSQPNDEDGVYLILDDCTSSQQPARYPDGNVNYSITNQHPKQHEEEPTYANLLANSPTSGEYDYVTMPCVAQAVANQQQNKQGYLFMGKAPQIPPR